jgi:hypothetical protein
MLYLPDPSNFDRQRPYLIEHTKNNQKTTTGTTPNDTEEGINLLYELHVLEENNADDSTEEEDAAYRSFAILASAENNNNNNSWIISNGKLYVPTPMDPLFWFLSAVSASSSSRQQQQWQPISQFLETSCQEIPTQIREMVSLEQLSHIVKTMRIDHGDNNDDKDHRLDQDCYYCKFDENRILQWLEAKRLAVQSVLLKQQQKATQQEYQHQNGAFCDNFHLTSEVTTTCTSPSKQSSDNPVPDPQTKNETCHIESIQIVSEYLDEYWRSKFWEASSVTPEQVLETSSPKKKRSHEQLGSEPWNHSNNDSNIMIMAGNGVENDPSLDSSTTQNRNTSKPNPAANAVTTGAKRLAKVNTKGIPKMSSFFAAKKKK